MIDVLKATMDLVLAPNSSLSTRVYNIGGFTSTPKDFELSICKYVPDFKVSYVPDERQAYADSWVNSVDDSLARRDWGYRHHYDVEALTRDMLHTIGERMGIVLP